MPIKVQCEECGATISVPDDALPGEIISCPDCGTEYEVVSVDPKAKKVELKKAEEVKEDWGE